MVSKKYGLPAFPCDRIATQDGSILSSPGLSMRDYFAAKAMQGLLAYDVGWSADDYATRSYEIAAAMLKERSK